jgi:hypothetical protein
MVAAASRDMVKAGLLISTYSEDGRLSLVALVPAQAVRESTSGKRRNLLTRKGCSFYNPV